MAENALITRRAAVLGALASSATLAVPAIAAVAPTEHPNDRVLRLGNEIKAALNDPAFVGFDHLIITRNYVGYTDAAGIRKQVYMARNHQTA